MTACVVIACAHARRLAGSHCVCMFMIRFRAVCGEMPVSESQCITLLAAKAPDSPTLPLPTPSFEISAPGRAEAFMRACASSALHLDCMGGTEWAGVGFAALAFPLTRKRALRVVTAYPAREPVWTCADCPGPRHSCIAFPYPCRRHRRM